MTERCVMAVVVGGPRNGECVEVPHDTTTYDFAASVGHDIYRVHRIRAGNLRWTILAPDDWDFDTVMQTLLMHYTGRAITPSVVPPRPGTSRPAGH